MIYNCFCVGEKEIISKKDGKKYTLLWVTLYNDKAEFVDCIKIFKNKSHNDIKLGVAFNAKKGFNKESREIFLYNIESININNSI